MSVGMSVHDVHDHPKRSSDQTMLSASMTDGQLVAGLAKGRMELLDEVKRRHGQRMNVVAARVVGPSSADDVVQEVLIRLATAASTIRDGQALPKWIATTTRNIALDHARSATVRREQLMPLIPDEPTASSTEHQIETSLISETLLGTIRPPDAALLTAHYMHDLSIDEIAGVQGISIGAVKVRLHRARARARDTAVRAGLRGWTIPGLDWLRRQLATWGPAQDAVALGISAVVVGLTIVLPAALGSPLVLDVSQDPGQELELSAPPTTSPVAPIAGAVPIVTTTDPVDRGPNDRASTVSGSDPEPEGPQPDRRIPVPGTDGEITIGETAQPAYEMRFEAVDTEVSNDRENSVNPFAGQVEEGFGEACRMGADRGAGFMECVERDG